MIRWKDKQMTVFGDPIQNRQSDSGFWSRCELSDAGKSIKLMIQFNDIESIKHMIEFKDKFGSLATNDSSFRHHPNRKTEDIQIWSKPKACWWCTPSKVGRARDATELIWALQSLRGSFNTKFGNWLYMGCIYWINPCKNIWSRNKQASLMYVD